ncbi:hypothetical protein PO909_022649 [Leuciscus waleckii]
MIQDTSRPRARITTFNGELPLAATRQPEPERKRTEPTLAPEVELHYESDQGCEPTTSADKGEVTMDNEDWLINFIEELATPTLSHQVPLSSLFLDSTINYDLFSLTYMDCVIFTVILSRFLLPPSPQSSASPPCYDCGSATGLGSLRSISAHRPVGSALAPPIFGSTGDPRTSR